MLAEIELVIPVASVPCERGFSEQNRVKTDARNRLSEDGVNRQMIMLNMHEKSLQGFNFDAAAEHFTSMKPCRK